jgi:hypothetical protein
MARVLEDVLTDPEATDAMRIRALKLAINIESREEDRQREHGSDAGHELPDATTQQELVEQLASTLAEKPLVARRLSAALASVAAG